MSTIIGLKKRLEWVKIFSIIFLQYLDIDKLNVDILGGTTKVVEAITAESDEIVVESVDTFLDKNGSILIGDEVIYYESSTSSPNVALSPGISYEQVKLSGLVLLKSFKWI